MTHDLINGDSSASRLGAGASYASKLIPGYTTSGDLVIDLKERLNICAVNLELASRTSAYPFRKLR